MLVALLEAGERGEIGLMGWKIVRDDDEAVCRALGVSGVWRPAADPVRGLGRKLIEESTEYLEDSDPGELV